MANSKINNMLIPNVSKIGGQQKVDVSNKPNSSKEAAEFKNLLEQEVNQAKDKHGIQLSIHAAKRLKERNLTIDGNEFFKLQDAFKKLRDKGGQDSLVITDKAAYIVDVNNNKVVTAINKESIQDNVFTKIDSTVIV